MGFGEALELTAVTSFGFERGEPGQKEARARWRATSDGDSG